ncbi:hypothetical protein [Motilimonas pumila]|uniref:DUF2214 family protein n=1 Tax=Motilimonas pumila TaxID=2303987 RepID=A0A418YHI8_9GAMM|nr:hypothetical protein [Motilimonas pumila]RJG49561.1 hypothetical protein D1Z90_06280 [Motilimonas pumila]
MKTLLLYTHVIALAAAIGAMIMTEYLISRRFRNFSDDLFEVIKLAHHTINWALLALWGSGIGFLILGYQQDPDYVMNQKVWAKMLIVTIVTINGYYIAKRVLPCIRGLSEQRPFVKSLNEATLFRFSVAVSLAGWLIAVFFGIAKFLSYQNNFFELLAAYVGLVTFFFVASFTLKDSPLTMEKNLARND